MPETDDNGAVVKKIELFYTSKPGQNDVDIELKSDGFGDDTGLILMYLHNTIQSILATEETA